ncbi:MAG: GNAT family N-acetyltransferase [Eubacteriales bacterium]|nr:GNAT family N-acetyltransferase [Eubacteriales bacterium]
MLLTTARLTLRDFEAEDGRDLFAYLSDPEVVRFEGYDPFTEAQAKQEAKRRAHDDAFVAVCLRDTGRLIGNLYFAKKKFEGAELGYVFSREFQHHGYATEAAEALLHCAFEEMGVHRVCAELNPLNHASERLVKRLGFRREAWLKQDKCFEHDKETGEPIWQDTLIYAALRDEWLRKHA